MRALGAAVVVVGASTGCQLIFGVGDPALRQMGTGGGGGTASSSSTGMTSSSAGGAGGAMTCTPGKVRSCYDGADGTEGVGICVGGMQTCSDEGSAWGPCMGEVTPKAETCASTDDEDCNHLDCVEWAKGVAGGPINALAPSPDGTVIVAGNAPMATPIGTGMLMPGPFIAKLKADGTPVWQVQIPVSLLSVGASGDVYGAGVVVSSTAIGSTTIPESQFVVKLDSAGDVLWAKSLAGLSGNGSFSVHGGPTSIAAAPDGDVLVAGVFVDTSIDVGDGPIPLGGTAGTAYVAKLSGIDGSGMMAASGPKWTLTFPAYKHGYAWIGPFVGVSAIGRISVLANCLATTIAGSTVGPGIAHIQLDAMATVNGSSTFDAQPVLSGTVAPDGTVIFTGTFQGTFDPAPGTGDTPLVATSGPPANPDLTTIYGDGFVVALDGGNTLRLARGFGTAGQASDAALDAEGNLVLTGNFTGVANLGAGPLDAGQGTAVLLAKFKPDGTPFWTRHFTRPQETAGRPHLAAASDNSIWLGGNASTWPLDFGTGPLNTSVQPGVGFLGRFAP